MFKIPNAPNYVYHHFKGRLYVVIGEAQHTETLERLVLYQDCDHDHSPNKTWARPYDMFYNDKVEDPEAPGRPINRFRRVGYIKDGKVEMFIGTHDHIPGKPRESLTSMRLDDKKKEK
jgi:hypothetical protein